MKAYKNTRSLMTEVKRRERTRIVELPSPAKPPVSPLTAPPQINPAPAPKEPVKV